MNKNRIPYKELEEERNIFLGIIIVLSLLFFWGIIQNNNLDQENQVLREPMNLTEERVFDYHDSGESFCENYNGTYRNFLLAKDDCSFVDNNDVWFYCDIIKVEDKYYFQQHCEVVK